MAFSIHETTTDEEFVAIVKVESEVYADPPNAFWEVMKGISLEECTSRQALWNQMDPTSHWIYAKDEKTGEVVGAMNWNIHEQNPFASGGEGPPIYWWPEGVWKIITLVKSIFTVLRFYRADEDALRKILGPFFANRPEYMSKPHLRKLHTFSDSKYLAKTHAYGYIVINICFVHPTRRHEGIGTLMMKWGLQKADEMGVETFVESTQDGIGFYKAHGFKHLLDLVLDPVAEDSENEELVALKKEMLEKKLLPFRIDFMVRPADRKIV